MSFPTGSSFPLGPEVPTPTFDPGVLGEETADADEPEADEDDENGD